MDDWISPKSKESRETGGKFVLLLFAWVVRFPISKQGDELAFRPLHLQSNVFCIDIYSNMTKTKLIAGTEPHTHRIWSTSFCLVVTWLTERTYIRTYASTDCTGGVGETIKRKGGVSQACLAKSTSFTLDIHNMVNWQLSKQDSHWPVSHDHIAGSCVNSSRWRDLFGNCPLTS